MKNYKVKLINNNKSHTYEVMATDEQQAVLFTQARAIRSNLDYDFVYVIS